ncbi:hypothetical protein Tcan_00080 [Toxocara canis]|uniref:Uncharacterized protein n=1 Tax=Toxocara canis TaxID=6265 RepID=A0A0B2VA77_TOXCA|nr:hypothetical protein Tcan_00080 [Toxocara canis]
MITKAQREEATNRPRRDRKGPAEMNAKQGWSMEGSRAGQWKLPGSNSGIGVPTKVPKATSSYDLRNVASSTYCVHDVPMHLQLSLFLRFVCFHAIHRILTSTRRTYHLFATAINTIIIATTAK